MESQCGESAGEREKGHEADGIRVERTMNFEECGGKSSHCACAISAWPAAVAATAVVAAAVAFSSKDLYPYSIVKRMHESNTVF